MRRKRTPDRVQPWLMGRIPLPRPALGYLYAARGIPWGKLRERHAHRIPDGWRELSRQRREA